MLNQVGRFIARHPELALELYKDHGTDNQLYGNVVRVRSQGNGGTTFQFDDRSDHYCLVHESNPVGALTATRHAKGQIDCAEFYPPKMFTEFGDVLSSSCKFRINPSSCSHRLPAMRWMTQMIWADLIQHGIRLDVINARRELVPFYAKMGYTVIEGWDFVHPHLGTDSQVLFLSVDPTIRSFFRDVFAEAADVLFKSRVLEVIGGSDAYR